MMKVLVTGASGFIGKHLVAELRNSEFEAIEANRASGDISAVSTWSNFSRADAVVHLAASTFVPDSWKDPGGFLRVNLQGTACALDYCRQNNALFIYMSSYLYGNPGELPLAETARLVAPNPYALSKKLSEEVCKFYADEYGVKVTIFRPFNVYGPGQSSRFLIPSILGQAASGIRIRVGDLRPRRDYIFVEDLVDAVIKAIRSASAYNVFNLGTGTSYSVSELIALVQDVMGTSLPVESAGDQRQGEILDTVADISKAMTVLGWAPKHSLYSGLKKTAQFL